MELTVAVQKLSALAHETRLLAFRRLVASGNSGCYPTDLAEDLQVPIQTLSFHLKELLRAKLVRSHRQGRSILYRADLDQSRNLLEYIATSCCEVRPSAETETG